MTNKKRSRDRYYKSLGRFSLTKKDILALEKIMRIHADERERTYAKRYGHVIKTTKQGHMPRRYVDLHVKVGRWKSMLPRFGLFSIELDLSGVEYVLDADSVKFLPKNVRHTSYFQVSSFPGIELTFSPMKTVLSAQTNYATGSELRAMVQCIDKIEEYLSGATKSFINEMHLR